MSYLDFEVRVLAPQLFVLSEEILHGVDGIYVRAQCMMNATLSARQHRWAHMQPALGNNKQAIVPTPGNLSASSWKMDLAVSRISSDSAYADTALAAPPPMALTAALLVLLVGVLPSAAAPAAAAVGGEQRIKKGDTMQSREIDSRGHGADHLYHTNRTEKLSLIPDGPT